MQAERKLSTSTLLPDVDNANVGSYKHDFKGNIISVSLFFSVQAEERGLKWKTRKQASYPMV